MRNSFDSIGKFTHKPVFDAFEISKNNDKRVLRDIVKATTAEIISESTLHGFSRIFRVERIYLKILWAIFFLCSVGVLSFIIATNLITFLSNGVNTNIAYASESPTYFPAITICNLNPFYIPRAQLYINNVLKNFNLTRFSNLTSIAANETAYLMLAQVLGTIQISEASDQNLTALSRKLLGFDISYILLSCQYNGIQCSNADFAWFQSYSYGNCFTFNGNSSSVKQVNNAGPNYGLQMELHTGTSNNEEFIYRKGFYVLVHNQSVTPFVEFEGNFVAVGYETQISVRKTFSSKLSSPYSSCIQNSTSPDSYDSLLYKAIFNQLGHKTYRQKFCFRLCYQQKVIHDCNCSDASLPNPFPKFRDATILPCIGYTDLTCLAKAKAQFEGESINTKCSSDCPLECSSVSYEPTITLARYPTTFYSNWLMLQSNLLQKYPNNQTTQANLKDSVLKVNIFYETIFYKNITETAQVTWDTLLGTLGGQINLFLGISVLTLGEVFELVGEIIRVLYMSKHKNKSM